MPLTAVGLRLLVFGLPGSGKSSLLGALVQAAGSQAAVLKGTLADDTGRLTALRQRTYAGTPPATAEEVVAYPVHFVPQGAADAGIAATLFDCDGRVAQGYLAGKRPLDTSDGALARAMLDADTVILTLDAAAAGSQVEAQLAVFRSFLTRLEEVRGGRADVADLPVYLVLTKCDQLAKPDDTFSKWMQRVEESKRRLGERFATFLTDDAGAAAFGTVDLNLWATAVRRPALLDRSAQDREPYGVAELFRQCLASAEGFDRRERGAGRRLELAVGGMGFLVVVLALLGGLFVASQPDTEMTHLEEQVQTALPEPDAPADRRLRGALPERLAQLDRIEHDPAFAKLPAKTQDAVHQAAAEIGAYLHSSRDYRDHVRQPYQAKDETEFDRFERDVRDFAIPAAYADAWAETRLARQLTDTRREYAAVRSAIAAEVQWIHARIEEGKQLFKQGNNLIPALADPDPARAKQGRHDAAAWRAAYAKYVRRPYQRLPGDEPIAGTVSFTYADLRRFRAVRQARKEWGEVKDQVNKTYDYVAGITAK